MRTLAPYSAVEPSLSRPGTQLPQPLAPDEAAAMALAAISGTGRLDLPADAFAALVEANKRLMDAPTDEIKAALGRQAVILEALFNRLLVRASLDTRNTAAYVKSALSTQRSLLNVLSALHQVNGPRPRPLTDMGNEDDA